MYGLTNAKHISRPKRLEVNLRPQSIRRNDYLPRVLEAGNEPKASGFMREAIDLLHVHAIYGHKKPTFYCT